MQSFSSSSPSQSRNRFVSKKKKGMRDMYKWDMIHHWGYHNLNEKSNKEDCYPNTMHIHYSGIYYIDHMCYKLYSIIINKTKVKQLLNKLTIVSRCDASRGGRSCKKNSINEPKRNKIKIINK